ncbi:MAG: ABC transporter permease subunit [Lachnospiraceae bacterium]|nr:ABC transporter permease subunit [Lachnospiraceae bacterium]
MRNLLSANFYSLKRSRVFWGCEIVCALYAAFLSCEIYMDMKYNGYAHPLDTGLFQFVVFSGIILSVFCSLYLGSELGDGIVRNKVVAGHRKSHIYLAAFLVCGAASVLFTLTYLAIYLMISVPLLLPLQADAATAALVLFSSLLLAFAYCGIFTLISLLSTNKAVVSTVCVILAFLLFMTGIAIKQRLDEPEVFEIVEYDEETRDGVPTGEMIPNNSYLAPSVRRTVYEFLNDFLPGSQGLQLSGMMEPELTFNRRLPLYSLSIIVLTTGMGLMIFRKKDLT